jgi:pimeloyl-ACP methyl ester carboxylesterase
MQCIEGRPSGGPSSSRLAQNGPRSSLHRSRTRSAELHLLDAGHFAVEEQPVEIAKAIIRFMDGRN